MRPLERACQPILAELLKLKFQPPSHSIIDAQPFIELFDDMLEKARSSDCSTFDIQAAHYALVAFADEMIAQLTSPDANHYQHSLQQHYFGENSAGEGFFLRLEDLLQEEGRHAALEIFALCLALGFQGCYLEASRQKLRTIRQRIREYLAHEPLLAPPWFISESAPQSKTRPKRFRFSRYLASFAVALSLGILNGWMMRRELQKQSRALVELSRALPRLHHHKGSQR